MCIFAYIKYVYCERERKLCGLVIGAIFQDRKCEKFSRGIKIYWMRSNFSIWIGMNWVSDLVLVIGLLTWEVFYGKKWKLCCETDDGKYWGMVRKNVFWCEENWIGRMNVEKWNYFWIVDELHACGRVGRNCWIFCLMKWKIFW